MVLAGVLTLVVAVLVPLLILFAVLGVLLVRRSRRVGEAIAADTAGERLLRGPEGAVYEGGSAGFPKIVGNGKLVLTERSLRFRILFGTGLEVPVADIRAVGTAATFRRSRVGGKTHLVITTQTGECGFVVQDTEGWLAALRAAAPALRD